MKAMTDGEPIRVLRSAGKLILISVCVGPDAHVMWNRVSKFPRGEHRAQRPVLAGELLVALTVRFVSFRCMLHGVIVEDAGFLRELLRISPVLSSLIFWWQSTHV